ncbi:MAG: hypothetical protein E6276_01810 [Clostridiales bacterium]|uniref:Replication initiator protein A (RepA) N-terminus n=1 Tax=Peptococcus niger TaxID=2741 RepID=A0A1G6VX32_PEPNI|nr:hypothetical protein [Peptococcus niger]MBS5593938.1 hypothetical protein [Clostridiales bacterium]MDU7244118.1 hypothetical protein [Clostridiales bacterium]SDD57973.1 hypothetical protein SAMN04489866_104162 [Peptococcus niger]
MIKEMLNGPSIVLDPVLFRAVGLKEALVLQVLSVRIEENKIAGRNFQKGRYWVDKPMREWQEDEFSFLTFDTLKRTFTRLREKDLILVDKFNLDGRDQTNWYAVNEDKLKQIYQETKTEKKRPVKRLGGKNHAN